VYSIGKLMMLKLRQDYEEQQGEQYSLRGFHDAVLWQRQRAVLGAPPPDARDGAADAALE
jgi:hypothetical protein